MFKQILFLGSFDMRLALQTASLRSSSYEKLNVHVIDNSNICGSKFSVSATTARNILITHIIVDEDFDPENKEDLQYLWNVWYDFQWTKETTIKRFLKDVNQLLNHQWPKNIIIPNDGNELRSLEIFRPIGEMLLLV